MSLSDLDPILVPPKRLACMGATSVARELDLAFLWEQLDVTDSDLSKHIEARVDAGCLRTRKTGRGSLRRTWIAITAEGRVAF